MSFAMYQSTRKKHITVKEDFHNPTVERRNDSKVLGFSPVVYSIK